MRLARNFLIVALVALVLTIVPGGGTSLTVLITVLTIAFFAGVGLFGARLYRENRFTLDALTPRQRAILYAGVAGAFLTFTATNRLFEAGGLGVLAWFALLGLASYAVFWAYASSRRYG